MALTKTEHNRIYREKIRKDPIRYKLFRQRKKEADKRYDLKHPKMRHKSYKINNWKQMGIIDTDLDLLYEFYIIQTNCMVCGIEFKDRRNRHLDHNHSTGDVRYICCCKCNTSFLASKYE